MGKSNWPTYSDTQTRTEGKVERAVKEMLKKLLLELVFAATVLGSAVLILLSSGLVSYLLYSPS